MACENLQQKSSHKGRGNSKRQDLQRQEGCGELIWNPDKQIRGPTQHNGAKAKGCQRHCFDMCCVAQHAKDTTGAVDRAPTPADDIAVLQNEKVGVCV